MKVVFLAHALFGLQIRFSFLMCGEGDLSTAKRTVNHVRGQIEKSHRRKNFGVTHLFSHFVNCSEFAFQVDV